MIALAWWVCSMAVYFVIGWPIAIWDMSSLYARIRECTTPAGGALSDNEVRQEARWLSTLTLIVWPLRLPYLVMAHATDRRDPIRLEREIELRDAKITELERKLL